MTNSEDSYDLEWIVYPYEFDRGLKQLLCRVKIRRYELILDYDREHKTLDELQRSKLKRLISLWTEVLGELQWKGDKDEKSQTVQHKSCRSCGDADSHLRT